MANGGRVGRAAGLVEDVEDERNYNQHQLTPSNVFTKSHDSGHCIVRCHVTGSTEIKSTGRLIGTCLPGRRDKRLSGRHARANRVDNVLTFMCANPSPHTLPILQSSQYVCFILLKLSVPDSHDIFSIFRFPSHWNTVVTWFAPTLFSFYFFNSWIFLFYIPLILCFVLSWFKKILCPSLLCILFHRL